jgi:methionyl-tRNA formyltransferase
MKFAFFGTDEFAVHVLETLKSRGLTPSIVISTPDKPQGRKLIITPSPSKVWAEKENITVLQPDKLNDKDFLEELGVDWDIFIVAAYGKIIPPFIFNLPRHTTLNIHPSLLPKLRGPSPVATAILHDLRDTGITIMNIDKEMDHGPIVAQKAHHVDEWPERETLETMFAIMGANLLADILPNYVNGKITPEPQDDTDASYCNVITKEMGLIDLNDRPYDNLRKIQALHGWPGTYFFVEHKGKKIRVSIKKAHYSENTLTIERVIPEGKNEMAYTDFLRGIQN